VSTSGQSDHGQPDGPRLRGVEDGERVDADVGQHGRVGRVREPQDVSQRVVDQPERQEQVVGQRQRHQLERGDRSLRVVAEDRGRDEVSDKSDDADDAGDDSVEEEREVVARILCRGR